MFTEFRHSLELLQRRLARVRPLAVLHGGQTDIERRQQLGRFTSGTASLLLATDVAGQGLNLQARARWVVSLELPWNPARIEQRLGRVDRIGQTRGVHGTLLVARDGAESGLLANLARRTLTARQTFDGAFSDTGMPDEIAIAAALIDQAPLPAAPANPPPVSVCRSWSRHARVAAGTLRSSRSLVSRWRGRGEAASALWSYFEPRSSLGLPADTGAVLAFTVPLLDLAGTVVERHVVALALRQRISSGAVDDVVLHCRRVAALVRFARANRAARFVRRIATWRGGDGSGVVRSDGARLDSSRSAAGTLRPARTGCVRGSHAGRSPTRRRCLRGECDARPHDQAVDRAPCARARIDRTSMRALSELGGSLLPARYLASAVQDGAIALPDLAATEVARRRLRRWWRSVEATCGPATGLRALFDLVAMPLAAMLGFRASAVQFERGRADARLTSAAGDAVVGLVVLPWALAPSERWRDVFSVARRFQTNWCLLLAPPFISIVEARASAVRRSADFELPHVLEEEPFRSFWLLAHASAFDGPAARVDSLVSGG